MYRFTRVNDFDGMRAERIRFVAGDDVLVPCKKHPSRVSHHGVYFGIIVFGGRIHRFRVRNTFQRKAVIVYRHFRSHGVRIISRAVDHSAHGVIVVIRLVRRDPGNNGTVRISHFQRKRNFRAVTVSSFVFVENYSRYDFRSAHRESSGIQFGFRNRDSAVRAKFLFGREYFEYRLPFGKIVRVEFDIGGEFGKRIAYIAALPYRYRSVGIYERDDEPVRTASFEIVYALFFAFRAAQRQIRRNRYLDFCRTRQSFTRKRFGIGYFQNVYTYARRIQRISGFAFRGFGVHVFDGAVAEFHRSLSAARHRQRNVFARVERFAEIIFRFDRFVLDRYGVIQYGDLEFNGHACAPRLVGMRISHYLHARKIAVITGKARPYEAQSFGALAACVQYVVFAAVGKKFRPVQIFGLRSRLDVYSQYVIVNGDVEYRRLSEIAYYHLLLDARDVSGIVARNHAFFYRDRFGVRAYRDRQRITREIEQLAVTVRRIVLRYDGERYIACRNDVYRTFGAVASQSRGDHGGASRRADRPDGAVGVHGNHGVVARTIADIAYIFRAFGNRNGKNRYFRAFRHMSFRFGERNTGKRKRPFHFHGERERRDLRAVGAHRDRYDALFEPRKRSRGIFVGNHCEHRGIAHREQHPRVSRVERLIIHAKRYVFADAHGERVALRFAHGYGAYLRYRGICGIYEIRDTRVRFVIGISGSFEFNHAVRSQKNAVTAAARKIYYVV